MLTTGGRGADGGQSHGGGGVAERGSSRSFSRFTGAQLDRARWATVVRETAELRLADGQLVIPTSKTDLLWLNDLNLTPNIVLQALPMGPFAATAKLSLTAR